MLSPFHLWMPDVYEGAPIIITAYLSTVAKIPLVFLFFKLYYLVFAEIFGIFQIIFVVAAVLSLIIGSVAAIYQVKIKRLLTYSMITNTGYILLGLCLQDISSIWITTFYLVSYLIIMLGLFFCFIVLRDRTNGLLVKKISLLVNLIEINPALAFSMLILLFSIAGVPPLLGFYGKFFLFMLSLKTKLYWIAIIFVIFSTISVFYYIRLIKLIYFNRSSGWVFFNEIPFSAAFVISLITLLNCLFFLNPDILFSLIYAISLAIYI